jgi:hypothetical protein
MSVDLREVSTRALVLCTLILLSACAALEREGTVAGPGGGSIVVKQGTPLVVALDPDPTGANSWAPANVPGPQLWPVDGSDFTVDPEALRHPGHRGNCDVPVPRVDARHDGDRICVALADWRRRQGCHKVVRYDVTVKPSVLFNLF